MRAFRHGRALGADRRPVHRGAAGGTLVYISQNRDVLLGGVALFSMAVGMSVPLLLMGLSAESLLPAPARWMTG